MIIANEERLQKISRIIDAIVFAATTLAIAGVFYEGMTLKWYGPVGIFVVCMDYTFLLATIIHLIADRKEKRISVHYFSLVILIIAIVMIFMLPICASEKYPFVIPVSINLTKFEKLLRRFNSLSYSGNTSVLKILKHLLKTSQSLISISFSIF